MGGVGQGDGGRGSPGGGVGTEGLRGEGGNLRVIRAPLRRSPGLALRPVPTCHPQLSAWRAAVPASLPSFCPSFFPSSLSRSLPSFPASVPLIHPSTQPASQPASPPLVHSSLLRHLFFRQVLVLPACTPMAACPPPLATPSVHSTACAPCPPAMGQAARGRLPRCWCMTCIPGSCAYTTERESGSDTLSKM